MSERLPKPVSVSRVEMTQVVMPGDANALGTAFGGRVVGWIDLAGAIAAQRHARMPVVTASIDQLNFLAPVRVGEIAILHAQVNAVFGSSMEVEVVVHAEDPLTGDTRRCCDAFVTMVALGEDGRPAHAPPLLLESDEERLRQQQALRRREARLEARGSMSRGL
jgi:acyl-CoA hydrolase